MRKCILLSIMLIQSVMVAQSTTTDQFAPDLNIKTPEVSSLLKFLETPVSYNTGLPNISMPIYSIKQGDINYPISVDYNASGVSVNERAGWVGMGFSINQPQVTRMVNGIPDDKGGFLTEVEFKVASGEVEERWSEAFFSSEAGDLDLESDEYRVMLPNGENIRFYFNQERSEAFPYGEIIQIPITNNKIKPLFDVQAIIGWKVEGDNGFVYTYTVGNSTLLTQSYTVSDDLPTLDGKSKTGNYLTSWMLSEIKSPTNNKLHFEYAPFLYDDCNLTGQRRDVAASQDYNFNQSVQTSYQKTVGYNYFLESIWGDFGRVNFILDTDTREDYVYGKKLDAISIYDKNLNKVNQYVFDYTYKTSPNPITPIYTCGYLMNQNQFPDLTKRLFLDKITILGNLNNLTTNKPFYHFDYNPIELPHRFSYATDWWGYYNGATNISLVPTRFRYDNEMPDRNVNSAYSQAGLLTEVFYPTGGSTKYEYESNRGLNDRPLVNRSFLYGGIVPGGYFDGINVIPSAKTNKVINSVDLIPVSNQSVNGGGRKIVYKEPFTIGENAIGYYRSILNTEPLGSNSGLPLTINLPINIKTNCNTCIYGDDSLPVDNGCSIYARVEKNNIIIVDNILISGNQERNFELQIGDLVDGEVEINSQDYTLVLEIFTGHQTPLNEQIFNYDTSNPNDNVYVELEWDVYNPDLVTKVGNSKYDMPIGGHRIKTIKTFDNPNGTPLEKRYYYKDENGIESGYFNFRVANFFMYANTFYLSSDSKYPLQFYHGQPVGYSFVTEKAVSGIQEIISTYKYQYFTNPNPNGYSACYLFNGSYGNGGTYPCVDDPNNGLLMENKIGNEKKIETQYTIPNPSLNTKFIIGFNTSIKVEVGSNASTFQTVGDIGGYVFGKYRVSNFHELKPSSVITTEFFNGNDIVTEVSNEYNTTNHLQLISQKTESSTQATQETKYFYPLDTEVQTEPYMEELVTANRISIPIKTETYRNGNKLSEQKTVFEKDATTSDLLLPKYVYTKKGNDIDAPTPEKRITYDKYDIKGNILQYSLENGTPVTIVWGYNNSQPIAKIDNTTYSTVENLITVAQTASNNSITGTEQNLLSALDAIRNALPNSMVTTYTYIPLVGVSTITDPKGNMNTYIYDSFGRLKEVKDSDGNTLGENEYHYRTQN